MKTPKILEEHLFEQKLNPEEEDICHATHLTDKAKRDGRSTFANWEEASTLLRSRGKEVSLDKVPYKYRLHPENETN